MPAQLNEEKCTELTQSQSYFDNTNIETKSYNVNNYVNRNTFL